MKKLQGSLLCLLKCHILSQVHLRETFQAMILEMFCGFYRRLITMLSNKSKSGWWSGLNYCHFAKKLEFVLFCSVFLFFVFFFFRQYFINLRRTLLKERNHKECTSIIHGIMFQKKVIQGKIPPKEHRDWIERKEIRSSFRKEKC